jgi:hypothetical protein
MGCLFLLVLIVLAFFWKCIPDGHTTWEANVPPAPPSSNPQPPWPTDLPRAPMVPTYDVGYLRWAGTLQPGQAATWGGIALSANTEIPVGGAVEPQPPCQVYGQVKLLAGPAVPFIILDEPNYRRWREGGKATARAMVNVTSAQDYSIAQSTEPQFLILDNREGSAELTVGLTGIQSCLRPAAAGDTPFQARPRPTATWRYREEQLTLVGYLLRLLGAGDEVQVMTPPEFH